MMKYSQPQKKHREWVYLFVLLTVFGILIVAQNVSAREHDRKENTRKEYRTERHQQVKKRLRQSHREESHWPAQSRQHNAVRSPGTYAWRHEQNYYRQSSEHRRQHRHKHHKRHYKQYYQPYRKDYVGWRYPVAYRWIERDYYQPRIVFLRDHPRFGAVYFNEALGYCYGGWNRCVPVHHHHNRHCPKWHRYVYDLAWYDYGPEVVIRAPEFSIRFDWM